MNCLGDVKSVSDTCITRTEQKQRASSAISVARRRPTACASVASEPFGSGTSLTGTFTFEMVSVSVSSFPSVLSRSIPSPDMGCLFFIELRHRLRLFELHEATSAGTCSRSIGGSTSCRQASTSRIGRRGGSRVETKVEV